MGTKIKYLAIFSVGITEFVNLQAWFACKSFTDLFHYSSVNLNLQIDYYIDTEKNTSYILSRLFNNKFIDSILNLLRFYLQFWDIRFGASWFTLIGYFGIFSGFYYIFSLKQKRFYHWIMLLVILFLPWIEIIIEPHINIMMKSIYLWAPFSLFSLYGISQFLNRGKFKKRLLVLLILTLISIWWIAFLPYSMPRYCNK